MVPEKKKYSLPESKDNQKKLLVNQQLCSISVDMDSVEVLLRFYGHRLPVGKRKNFYEIVVPRFLEVFGRYKVKATFFVVGSDLRNRTNQKFLAKLVEAGHEIANHTYSHPFGLHTMSWQQRVREIEKSEKLIEQITGIRPVGFRAPGYAIDHLTLEILEDRGYLYDSSVFPTFISPLFKLAHKILLRKRDHVNSGMGDWRTCLAPHQPYFPHKQKIYERGATRTILEIPVSVTPYLRLPFYANFHLLLGTKFFDVSFGRFKRFDINYLFHGIELVDFRGDQIDENLSQHPNITRPLEEKIEFYEHVLARFLQQCHVVCLRDLAENYQRVSKSITEG